MFLMEDPDFAVVGASPEVHFRLTGDQVENRPIVHGIEVKPKPKTLN